MREVVKDIVTIVPKMTSTSDREGNYPLLITIQKQQSYDTAHELFTAFPEETKDVVTNSIPLCLLLEVIGKLK